MKEIFRPILMAVIAVIVIMFVISQIKSCRKGTIPFEMIQLDTIWVKHPYEKPPKPKEAKPVVKIVVRWLKPETPNYSPDFRDDRDSLIRIIDSLKKDTVKINKGYFYHHPKAPKLLFAKFTGKEMRLDLLRTDGEIYSDIYPVDYNMANYIFDDGVLSAIKPDRPKRKLQRVTSFGFNYEALTQTKAISAEQRYQYGLLEGSLGAIGTISKEPQVGVYGRIGVLLYGKQERRK